MQQLLESKVLKIKLHPDLLQSFKTEKKCLDTFSFGHPEVVKYKVLSFVLKMSLTLRQGRTAVEH